MIAFDFDGVVCDVHHIFRGHFFDRFGVIVKKEDEQKNFDFTTVEGEFPSTWWNEIPVAITKYQHIAPPYVGAIAALRAMYMDFDLEFIQIITAREPSEAVKQVTRLWCQNNFTFPFQIDFCASSEEKFEIIKLMEIKYFIDDRFKTVQSLAPILKTCFLLNREWNIRDAELHENVERVESIWAMRSHLRIFA
jgi:hypothetical protein